MLLKKHVNSGFLNTDHLSLSHMHATANAPGGWVVFAAAAGVDDWLVVIETAKGKFLPDGLPLIPLGLVDREKKKDLNM